jgi:hypothetical protein
MMNSEMCTDFLYEKDLNNGDVTLTLHTSNKESAFNLLTFQKLFWAVDILENFETSKSMRVANVNKNESTNKASTEIDKKILKLSLTKNN